MDKTIKKKQRQLTVNYVVKVKGAKTDFGMGPGVIGTQQVVFHDERGRGFDSPLFWLEANDMKRKIVEGLIEVQGLVNRPPSELKGKLTAVEGFKYPKKK